MGSQLKPALLLLIMQLHYYCVYCQSGQSFYYFYRPNQPMFVNAQTYGADASEQSSYQPTTATFQDFQNPRTSIAPTRIRQQTPSTLPPHLRIDEQRPLLEKIAFSNTPLRVGSTPEPSARFQSFFDQPFQYFNQKTSNPILPYQQQQQYYNQPVYQDQQLPAEIPTPVSTTRPHQFFNYHRIVQPTSPTVYTQAAATDNELRRRQSVSLTQVHTDPISYEVKQFYSTVHNSQGPSGYSFAIGTDKNSNPTASVNVNLGPSIFSGDGEPYDDHTQKLRAITSNREQSFSYNHAQNLEKIEQQEMETMELKKMSKVTQNQKEELQATIAPAVSTTTTTETAALIETTSGEIIKLDGSTAVPLLNADSISSGQKRLQKTKNVTRKRLRVRGRNRTSTITKKERDEPLVTTEEYVAVPPEVTTVISISTTEKIVTTTVEARRPSKPGLRRRIKITPELTTTTISPPTTTERPFADPIFINPSRVIPEVINSFPQPSTKIIILPRRTTTTEATTTTTTTEPPPEVVTELREIIPSTEEPTTTPASTTESIVQKQVIPQTTGQATLPSAIVDGSTSYSDEDDYYDDYQIDYGTSNEANNGEVRLENENSEGTTIVAPIAAPITETTPDTTTFSPTESTAPAVYTRKPTAKTVVIGRMRVREKVTEPQPESTTELFNLEPYSTTETESQQELATPTPSTTEMHREYYSEDDSESTSIGSIVEPMTSVYNGESSTTREEPITTEATSTSTIVSFVNAENDAAPKIKPVIMPVENIEPTEALNDTSSTTTVSSTSEVAENNEDNDTKLSDSNELETPLDEPFYSDEYDENLPTDSEEKIGQAQRLSLENTLKKLRSRVRNSTSENPLNVPSSEDNSGVKKFVRKPLAEFPINSNSNRAVYSNDDEEENDTQSRSQIIQKIQKFRTKFSRVHFSPNDANKVNSRSTTKRPRRVTRPSSRFPLNQITLVDGGDSSSSGSNSNGGSNAVDSKSSAFVKYVRPESESADNLEITRKPLFITTTQSSRQTNPPERIPIKDIEDNINNVNSQFNVGNDEEKSVQHFDEVVQSSTTAETTSIKVSSSTTSLPPTTTTENILSSTTQSEQTTSRNQNIFDEAAYGTTTEFTESTTVSNIVDDNQAENNKEGGADVGPITEDTGAKNSQEKQMETSEGNNSTEPEGEKPFVGERKGRVTKIRRKIISRLIIHEIIPTKGPVTTTSTTTTTEETPISVQQESEVPRVRRLRKKMKKQPTIITVTEANPSTEASSTENYNFQGVTQHILNSTSVIISSNSDDDEDIIFTTVNPVQHAEEVSEALENSKNDETRISYKNSSIIATSSQSVSPRKVRIVMKKRSRHFLLPPPA